MPLNEYQKNILRDFRKEQLSEGVEFLTLTGSGFTSFDAYRKQTYIEVSSYFSGSVALNPYSEKRGSEGGFYKLSEIVIIAARANKTTAELKDVKIRYQGIKFRVSKIADCPDTDEIVIYASRLE